MPKEQYVPLNDYGSPLDTQGLVDISAKMLFKCQSCYTLEHLHLHHSSHIAQAFTKLAFQNQSVNIFVVEKMKEWNRRELSLPPDHDGDVDSCLEFISDSYALELSLNLRQLKFRPHWDIQDLLWSFKGRFLSDHNICKALIGCSKSLGMARVSTRKKIRELYDSKQAEVLRKEKEKHAAKQMKLASTHFEK